MALTWQSKILSNGIRAIVGGQFNGGVPVVFVSGWPETAEAFSDLFEPVSQTHRFLALDPPGLGDSAPSTGGYDTQTISNLMAASIHEELGGQQYHLVGHDVGAWIAYPWASQHGSSVKTLTIIDSTIPGLAPPAEFPLSNEWNKRLFQFSFNALPELPEILTRGREREFLTWNIHSKAFKPFPQDKLEIYVRSYSRPEVMSCGFEYYRAVEMSSKQNREFGKTQLAMPVMALGGAKSAGANMLRLAGRLAANVSGGAIDDCGHFVMEEQPEALTTRLLSFFAEAGHA